jgi:hypothetical protein
MFFLMMASHAVRDIFESREAGRIGMVIVGIAALVATAVLLKMVRGRTSELEEQSSP